MGNSNKQLIVSAVGFAGMGLMLWNGMRLVSPTVHDRGERGTGTSFADKYEDYSRADMIEELYKSKAQLGLLLGIAAMAAAATAANADFL